MPGEISNFLGSFLSRGPCVIGQVRIAPDYSMSHLEDAGKGGLEIFTNPHDALEVAKYDDAGQYRPLKTAPNLRHGWALQLRNLADASLALDFLYPAALGTALAFVRNQLTAVNLRETLARQSGMYAVVKKITDKQAESVITITCNHKDGCMRHILWPISPGRLSSLSRRGSEVEGFRNEIPLLCAEACNLLVAAGRKIVKTPPA
ncbi:MAG TPA: DR2241 family protein [Terrimicrobiaceae bacterium]